MDARQFSTAVDTLGKLEHTGGIVNELFVDGFSVDGVAVSTLGELLGSETISASDEVAARIDELQLDLGEGPAWHALSSAKAVIERDVRASSPSPWPAFAAAVASEDVGAIFALPMVIGPLRIGAIDLYSREPRDIDPDSVQQGQELASIVARQLFKRTLAQVGQEHPDDPGTPRSRRILHQATGMVLAQLNLSAADARLVIEGHAFSTGQPVIAVAQRIVDRDLVLGIGEDAMDV